MSRLKKQWEAEHAEWQKRGLSEQRYVYWWADGVYSNVRMDDRLCLLVIIGVTEQGRKELVVVEDGQRESEASWKELLTGLRERGLTTAPKLAVGDGAMGFWAALSKVYPETEHQRCWVHKTANVLNKLPKSVQPKVKADLHEIWMAETRDEAHKAFDRTVKRFEAKYPRAMECLAKDREELLAFYDYPADSTPSGHPVRSHLARHSTAIWPPVPRPSGRAVGAQRRRGGIVSLRCPVSSISSSVCASTHP